MAHHLQQLLDTWSAAPQYLPALPLDWPAPDDPMSTDVAVEIPLVSDHLSRALAYSANTQVPVDEKEEKEFYWERMLFAPSPLNGGTVVAIGDGEEDPDSSDALDQMPVLVVNLSRFRDQHFNRKGAHPSLSTEADRRAFYTLAKRVLYAHFAELPDLLFDQQIASHATYATRHQFIESLRRTNPEDVVALIDYPATINGQPTSSYFSALSTDTPWASLDCLLHTLKACSWGLTQKLSLAYELERLAKDEHARRLKEQVIHTAEIDRLAHHRDAIEVQLVVMRNSDEFSEDSEEHALELQLEDVERQLEDLVLGHTEEPELERHEDGEGEAEMVTPPGNQVLSPDAVMAAILDRVPQVNVLDRAIAMVLARASVVPTPPKRPLSMEAHVGVLLTLHTRIRRLWVQDFGQLP